MTDLDNVTAGLSPAMRQGLLDEHAGYLTQEALVKRGMVEETTHVDRRGGHYQLTLTSWGRRVAKALRAELDATPIVPADVTVPDYYGAHAHAYCYGALRKALELADLASDPRIAQVLEHCEAVLTASGYREV